MTSLAPLLEDDGMAWIRPAHSKGVVDRAGQTLIAPIFDIDNVDKYFDALNVVNNWRASHSFPLNTFTVTLKRKANQVDPGCLVAQRIKRLASIELKLRRFSGLRLSQIQDIGGCRAVLTDVDSVRSLVALYGDSDLKHSVKTDDYIATPQESGYRGIHMIYTYNSDRNAFYNGHKIEMQLRSQFQHAWGDRRRDRWYVHPPSTEVQPGRRRLATLLPVDGDRHRLSRRARLPFATPLPTPAALRSEIADYASRLDLINRLEAYGSAIRFSESEPFHGVADYFLIVLDPGQQVVEVKGYPRNQLTQAQEGLCGGGKGNRTGQ